jgi:hypothetical protein
MVFAAAVWGWGWWLLGGWFDCWLRRSAELNISTVKRRKITDLCALVVVCRSPLTVVVMAILSDTIEVAALDCYARVSDPFIAV